MATILVDVDGVIADIATPVYKLARKLTGRKLPKPETWNTYDFADALKLTRNEREYFAREVRRQNNLGWRVEFLPNAHNFLEHLAMGHEVVFVTAPWIGLEHWVEARMSLLETYLGRKKFSIVFTKDKHLVKGDWLIDDHYENIAKNHERGIMLKRPWNERFCAQAQWVAEDYKAIVEIIDR